MLDRLILAYLARKGSPATISELMAALGFDDSLILEAIEARLVPADFVMPDSDVLWAITPAGIDSLRSASTPGDVSPDLTASLDLVFAEGGNPDASFLPDQRAAGFTALDGRDLAYLVAEYGIGHVMEGGDIAILGRVARLSRLASNLAARL